MGPSHPLYLPAPRDHAGLASPALSLRELLAWLLLLYTVLAVLFAGLGSYPLYDPDEGRNAEVAREVVVENHWIPPTLNGQARYQKPPLYYWLVAASFEALGINETAARLPSALAALASVLLTVLLGRRLWGTAEGLWAGAILATSLVFVAYSRIVIFDMVLTLFTTCSIALFWWGVEDQSETPLLGSALSASLAFLTKGPVGVLIPMMAVLPPLAYRRRRGRRFHVPWLNMLAIFALVSLPVYLAAEARCPGYCKRFFWEENVLRFLTHRYHREGPIFYYPLVILVGLFPWTWLLRHLPATARRMGKSSTEELLFLGSWILLPTLFFTLSRSKLPHYVLPTFPAWALLLSRIAREARVSRQTLTLTAMAAAVLYLGCLPLVSHQVIAHRSAADVVRRAQLQPGIPLLVFKARGYSLAFYAQREVATIHRKRELAEALSQPGRFYLFTTKKRLATVQELARPRGRKVRVLGSSQRYTLLAIESRAARGKWEEGRNAAKNSNPGC